MKGLIDFIKTTVIGGVVVIVPLTVFVIVLGVLLDSLIGLTSKVAEQFPDSPLSSTVMVVLVAVLAIVLLCFFTGLLLSTRPGKALTAFLERHIAQRIPLYGVLKNLTAQFVGMRGTQFQPVEADLYGASTWVLGFIVEDLPDGRLAIFVPSIPMVTVGQVFYIPKDRVRILDAPAMEVVNAITQWGVGSKVVFEKHGKQSDPGI